LVNSDVKHIVHLIVLLLGQFANQTFFSILINLINNTLFLLQINDLGILLANTQIIDFNVVENVLLFVGKEVKVVLDVLDSFNLSKGHILSFILVDFFNILHSIT
jgi:hypothetical protein